MKKKLFLAILLMILLFPLVSAATIHGTVYNIELNKVSNAIVEIDTIPKQTMVSKQGTYSFNVPQGEYTITAKTTKSDLLVKEEIIVREEGDYVLDLILFLNLEAEEEIFKETEMDLSDSFIEESVSENGQDVIKRMWISLVVFLAVIGFYILYMRLKKKKPEKIIQEHKGPKSDIQKLVDYIKKQDGRTTQKDIRKNFPQSEAKISLMIAELEDKGKIKKIKKGRGNIIILN